MSTNNGYQTLSTSDANDYNSLMEPVILENIISFLPLTRKELRDSNILTLRLVCKTMNEHIESNPTVLKYELLPPLENVEKKEILIPTLLKLAQYLYFSFLIGAIPGYLLCFYVRVHTPDYINESDYPDWVIMAMIITAPIITLVLLLLEILCLFFFFFPTLGFFSLLAVGAFVYLDSQELINNVKNNFWNAHKLERKEYYENISSSLKSQVEV